MNKRIYLPTVILLVGLLLAGCNYQFVTGSGKVVTETRQVGDFTGVTLAGIGELSVTQGETVSVRIEAEDNLIPYFSTTVQGSTLTIGIKDQYLGVNLRPTKPVKFYVTAPKIEALTLAGSGNITAGTLQADSFSISLLGSGNITTGNLTTNGNADIRLAGSGNVTLGKLTVSEVTSSITGSGNVTLESLTASKITSTTAGSGDVTLSGEVTEQHIEILGSGDYLAASLQSQTATLRVSGSGDSQIAASDTLDVTILGSGSVTYSGTPQINVNISGSGKVNRAGQ